MIIYNHVVAGCGHSLHVSLESNKQGDFLIRQLDNTKKCVRSFELTDF